MKSLLTGGARYVAPPRAEPLAPHPEQPVPASPPPARPDSITVVRVIARLNVGGPARHVVQLTRGLANEYPTLLVAGSVSRDEIELPVVTDTEAVLRLYRLPELGRAIRPFDDLRTFFKLVRVLRAIRPTIVHTHTAKAGALGRLAAALVGIPIRIHTYHGTVFRGYFGSLRSAVVVTIEWLLARLTTRIVVLSESQRQEVTTRFRITSPEKVTIIPLGLELGRFALPIPQQGVKNFRDELGIPDGPVITTVGRLVPIKNHCLFLKAAKRVLERRPDAQFLVVGGGPEENKLRAETRKLQIEKNIHFLGWRHDLERVYALSDLVALSSDNEGTPVALIEALAAGKKVVATDVGGVGDLLDGGRLGQLVPPGDPDALAAAILETLDSRAPVSHAEEIRTRFGAERLLNDMASLYERVLLGTAPRRMPVKKGWVARAH